MLSGRDAVLSQGAQLAGGTRSAGAQSSLKVDCLLPIAPDAAQGSQGKRPELVLEDVGASRHRQMLLGLVCGITVKHPGNKKANFQTQHHG